MKIAGPAIVALLSLGTVTAHAEPPRLAIFARLNSPENKPRLDTVALLEKLAQEASYALGVTVVRPSELLTTDEGRSALDCGADLKCLGARLRAAAIDLGLVVSIDLSADSALVLVLLVDSKAAARGRIIDEAPAEAAAEIETAVLRAAARLLNDAGYIAGGRLRLNVSPFDASVKLEDEAGVLLPVSTEAVLSLRPGNYRALAEKDGYLPKTAPVAVAARGESELRLELEADSPWYTSAWFWVPVAAVVVAGAVTTAVFVGGGAEDPPIKGDDGTVITTLDARP